MKQYAVGSIDQGGPLIAFFDTFEEALSEWEKAIPQGPAPLPFVAEKREDGTYQSVLDPDDYETIETAEEHIISGHDGAAEDGCILCRTPS